MPTRTARTAWNGTVAKGGGQVEFTSSKLGTFDVSFPRRMAEEANGVTSPEELIAAAHSSCYSMALAGEVARAGGSPVQFDVTADVTITQDDKGLNISAIALTVRAEVENMDAVQFEQAAQAAKVGCPVSKALKAVPISLDAALEN
ncbi:MAG: OsmC family peroxiredoxin [Corynebacteriales bacterium]|nr:OsmC family peroxiredoxin [Mycobacteriales bacterium]